MRIFNNDDHLIIQRRESPKTYKDSMVMLQLKRNLNELFNLSGRERLVKENSDLGYLLRSGRNRSNYQSVFIWVDKRGYFNDYDKNLPIRVEVIWYDGALRTRMSKIPQFDC